MCWCDTLNLKTKSTTDSDCAINPKHVMSWGPVLKLTTLSPGHVSADLSWVCVVLLITGCLSTGAWRWKTLNVTALTWTTRWQVCKGRQTQRSVCPCLILHSGFVVVSWTGHKRFLGFMQTVLFLCICVYLQHTSPLTMRAWALRW